MGSVRLEKEGTLASRRGGLVGVLGRMIRSPVTAALGLILLDVSKPLHIDDTAYYHYAAHIAVDPLHPYAFEILWGQGPIPEMDVLAPPVLPYWWAAAIRLCGDRPWLWKLWLFPLALILTTSLRAIGRRYFVDTVDGKQVEPFLESPLIEQGGLGVEELLHFGSGDGASLGVLGHASLPRLEVSRTACACDASR